MSKKIFINYRLDDTASYARGIGEGLSRVFGADQVFMDIKSLPAGRRFEQELDKALRECAVFIVVIGPGWLEYIKTRSRNERDYVSAEIAAALKRDIPIIGFIIGLILPMVGVILMYFKWGNHEGISQFLRSLTHQRGMASKVLTLSLLTNIIPFVYCTYKRYDYIMRGILIATMIYALLIVLIMFVW